MYVGIFVCTYEGIYVCMYVGLHGSGQAGLYAYIMPADMRRMPTQKWVWPKTRTAMFSSSCLQARTRGAGTSELISARENK